MAEETHNTNALVLKSLNPLLAIQASKEVEVYIPHGPPELQVSQATA